MTTFLAKPGNFPTLCGDFFPGQKQLATNLARFPGVIGDFFCCFGNGHEGTYRSPAVPVVSGQQVLPRAVPCHQVVNEAHSLQSCSHHSGAALNSHTEWDGNEKVY